jgi:hypothetical protein
MKSFDVKAALDTLLADNAGDTYSLLGVQNRKGDALDLLAKPQVTTSYQNGDYPKQASRVGGVYKHDFVIHVDILCAAVCQVDLSILNNPVAPPAQVAAAITKRTNATAVAEAKADAMIGTLFDIIMRPQNFKFGLDYNPNRWVTTDHKYPPQQQGSLVLVAATLTLTGSVMEPTTEEVGTPAGIVDAKVTLQAVGGTAADEAKQGVMVDNTEA